MLVPASDATVVLPDAPPPPEVTLPVVLELAFDAVISALTCVVSLA